MTWQRIDNDTYIDDTLVGCAEYQLFIDEMREHGKYHQPDHWTTHQFSKGQAQEPILGIRHSDAIKFCEWLTKQQGNRNFQQSAIEDAREVWRYRIPLQQEAETFSLQPKSGNYLGYWHMKSIASPSLSWAGPIPADLRNIFTSNSTIVFNIGHDLSGYEFGYSPHHSLSIGYPDPMDFIYPYREIMSNHNFVLDLENVSIRITILEREVEQFSPKSPQIFKNILNRELTFDNSSEFSDEEIEASITRNIYEVFHWCLSVGWFVIYKKKSERLLRDALEIYFDLKYLIARIQRSCPAFEGIRLVKERIK